MNIHELKCWPIFFDDIRTGRKPFDLRADDRDFNVGDQVVMQEFKHGIGTYTGRSFQAEITYIGRAGQGVQDDLEKFGLRPRFCVLGLKVVGDGS